MSKNLAIQFIIMVIVGMAFNPMNMLAYRFNDLYVSLTLFYGGLLMASNMLWSHEIIHYLTMNKFNSNIFLLGICLSLFIYILLRKQFLVNDNQWLKRMISHHSTALTTSNIIYKKTKNNKIKKLAKDIIETQEKEIILMNDMLDNH